MLQLCLLGALALCGLFGQGVAHGGERLHHFLAATARAFLHLVTQFALQPVDAVLHLRHRLGQGLRMQLHLGLCLGLRQRLCLLCSQPVFGGGASGLAQHQHQRQQNCQRRQGQHGPQQGVSGHADNTSGLMGVSALPSIRQAIRLSAARLAMA